MRLMTILNLWKTNKGTNTPLLGTNETLEKLDFLQEYLLNYKRYDRNFTLTRGFFYPLWNLNYEDTEQEVLDMWKEDVDNFFWKHKEDYQRLWDALQVEYDPLNNFDRYEEYEDTNSGSDKRTNDYGARHSSNVTGKQENSDDWGKTEQETETLRAGFDSAGYVADNKQISSTDRNFDEHTIGSRTDTNDINAAKDTENTEYGHKLKHTGHLYGNIGVTTSQQMLQSEIDLRERFNFYDMIFTALIKELCTWYDDGINAFALDDCKIIMKEIKRESEEDDVEAYVTQLANGARITIIDKTHGTTTADVYNGTNGLNGTNGKDGKDGKDGLTPTFEIDERGHLLQGYEEE